MSANGAYRIRPAGRHILTIGRDLIQDSYAAVVELVKNAYDADSSKVNIEFAANSDESGYSLVVCDDGHGMSRDDVINKWMVPSTTDKLDRRRSPAGRIMQGRKGVGRYAASILGTDLLMETVSANGEKTTVYVEWKNFEDAQYLDDVEILIETAEVCESPGTRLIINGDEELLTVWDKKQFNRLRFELKKLISPVDSTLSDDNFSINIAISGFPDTEDIAESVDPYPIFELFDYRITGRISADGNGTLLYSLQKIRNITDENIHINFDKPTGCGELVFDIRVYDRDKDAIDALIQRGLKDESGNYVGKLEARRLLNLFNGIGVYRNGFRIRPLGDADFDWLKLNERRVQNPSMRIGSNQAIGFVQIQSDDESGLIEKSARDGLKENYAFERLKEITGEVITKLEERRFNYRRKVGLGKPTLRVQRELDRLFSYDEMKQEIQSKLTTANVSKTTADEIIATIKREEEDKNRIANEIKQAVAIYQGQATLGKIINVILHEGRQPLSYFRNQIPNMKHWYKSYMKTKDLAKLEKITSIAVGIGENAEVFVMLFSRLDPLASGKRSKREHVELKHTIGKTIDVFAHEMKLKDVHAEIKGSDEFKFQCWPQDIYSIFTNLVDNSLYWMNEKHIFNRRISIELVSDGDELLHIDYRDTGPGIDRTHIESEVIFEPEFSTKFQGTGLGLAIAGESAARNDLELRAFESNSGAWFRLQPKTESA